MNEKEVERRRKISLSLLGNSRTLGHKLSEEHKRNISSAHIGSKRTEEAKKKMSDVRKGIVFTKEHIENLRKSHTGKKNSIETRLKMSLAHKGDKASNWQGGITKVNDSIRGSIEIRLWREAVFARDNWTCQECGARNGNGKRIELEAHHIKSFSRHKELRTAIENGITLCKKCHKKTDNFGYKAQTL